MRSPTSAEREAYNAWPSTRHVSHLGEFHDRIQEWSNRETYRNSTFMRIATALYLGFGFTRMQSYVHASWVVETG